MTHTVSTVLAWRPEVLDEAARLFTVAGDRVEETGFAVHGVRQEIPGVWEGESGQAAADALADPWELAADLAEAFGLVARTLSAVAEAVRGAQGSVCRGREIAEDHGLVLGDDGRVVAPPPTVLPSNAGEDARIAARRAHRTATSAAEDAQYLARQGLAAAQEADEDATRVLRESWRIARREHGGMVGQELVAQVLHRAFPAADVAPGEVAGWWASLSTAAQEALLAREWARLGNLDGIPYEVRIQANRLAIGAALEDESRRADALDARIAELEEQIAELGSSEVSLVIGLRDALEAERGKLVECEALRRWYQELLTGATTIEYPGGSKFVHSGHQVVLFDPAGGRFAEIVGDLSAATSVGVYVPGTGAAFGPDDGHYNRAASFVSGAEPAGSLAMVTFIGGPMPQDIPSAARNSYADRVGPRLARFVAGLDCAPGVSVTVLGHSYGGAVVGAAESAGMRADRILHVESAGIGPGVDHPDDLAHPDTPRYSMTAPGDLIETVQGKNAGGLGLGDDPDEFPGVVRLETGRADHNDPNSSLMQGLETHSGVFDPKSMAWANMRAVLTGGTGGEYVPPVKVPTGTGWGMKHQYPMQDPDFTSPEVRIP